MAGIQDNVTLMASLQAPKRVRADALSQTSFGTIKVQVKDCITDMMAQTFACNQHAAK